VRVFREAYGEPALEGRLLFHDEAVKANTPTRTWSATYAVWITGREIVLRIPRRAESSMYASRTIRIPVENVAYVQSLPDGKVRLGLTGGEGRSWDLAPSSQARLLQTLQALGAGSGASTL